MNIPISSCWSLLFAVLLAAVIFPEPAFAQPDAFAKAERIDLQNHVHSQGRATVIVGLQAPQRPAGKLPAEVRQAYRTKLGKAQETFVKRIAGTHVKVQRRFNDISYLVLEVDAQGLELILTDPAVASIEVDRRLEFHLMDTPTIVQAASAWAGGYHGEGQTVAILDTGVDTSHPFVSGKLKAEACFSSPGTGTTSLCPGGVSPQIGVGAGSYCPDLNLGCYHGTHVAGIAVGKQGQLSGGAGMAPAAGLIPVQVFSKACNSSGCSLGSSTGDLLEALQWVYTQHDSFPIAAVNMSLGSGGYTAACDFISPSMKSAIDLLLSADIATIVSSGNDGFTDRISFPACISTAISVGSTTKQNQVSTFSNAAPTLSLLAPGQSIYSSYPGGSYTSLSGTSMAAPHVAGAWALIKAARPISTVQEILNAFQTTGLPVADFRQGLVKPLIQIGDPGSQGALGAILGLPGAKVNYALASNGGFASASSTFASGYPVAAVNDGDRTGAGWGSGGGWNDATNGAYPDWVQIDFNGPKAISEIDVVTLQDNYVNPVDPIDTMPFSLYGITVFDVQYWTGSAWATVPGGSVTGNNNVWTRFLFAPISTQKVRVLIHGSLGSYSRLVELEAWGVSTPANLPPTVDLTAPIAGASFNAPANITITASASDPDGAIAKVEFFRDGILLGEVLTPPYSLTWTNVAAGSYTLTVVATDNTGAATTSAPVVIAVIDPAAVALDQDLYFTPSNPPCRIFDTRNYAGGAAVAAGSYNHYHVHGDAATMAAQGGNAATGCPAPKGEPMAVLANFTVIPSHQSGYIRVYPFGGVIPASNWLNFLPGTNIANAGIVSTAYMNPVGFDLTVFNGSETHLVGDVMGYFYALGRADSSYDEVKAVASTSGAAAVVADGAIHMAGAFVTHSLSAGDSVLINASQAFGSLSGASGLDLWPCYRTSSPLGVPVTIGGGIRNLMVRAATRLPMSVNGAARPGAGTFDFGMCYRTSNSAWDNNDKGYVSITVLNF